MSVLGQRLLFGTLLLGGTLLLLWLDALTASTMGFFTLTLVFGVVGWWEYTRLVGFEDRLLVAAGFVTVLTGLVGTWLLLSGGVPSRHSIPFLLLLPMLFPALLVPLYLRRTPGRERMAEVAMGTLGAIYLGAPLLCCLSLRALPHDGARWVLLLVLVVKGNDIGAYLVGRKLGRTPLSPVSPKKSVEGSVAGLMLGSVIACGFAWGSDPLFGVGTAFAVGLSAGIAGQTGDLVESYLKRSVGAKESGMLVPTFGGALDLMDSILLAAPVVYCLALFLGG